MDAMSDYHVKVTVKNGRIIKRMRECGFETVAALARAAGVSYQSVVDIIAMRGSPLKEDGTWRFWVPSLATALKVEPEELFSERQMTSSLKKNTSEMFVDEDEVARIMAPSPHYAIEVKDMADRLISCLNEKERSIVRMRMDGLTLKECGNEFSVGHERIRQIEMRAYRKMRQHAKAKEMTNTKGERLGKGNA